MIMRDVIRNEAGGATAEAISDLVRRLRVLERTNDKSLILFQGSGVPGQIIMGANVSLVNALDLAPALFLEIDIPNATWTLYATIPINTTLTNWNWTPIITSTMS